MADVLRPEEERIIEARGLLEALTVPPMLGATLASLRSALDAMTGPLPQQHALGKPPFGFFWLHSPVLLHGSIVMEAARLMVQAVTLLFHGCVSSADLTIFSA